MAPINPINMLIGAMDKVILMSGAPTSWPPYATRTFGFLVVGAIVLAMLLGQGVDGGIPASKKEAKGEEAKKAQRTAFRRFQVSYLTVFLITMLADWLQGTNMYTLYSAYEMPVGVLFLTGFTSSAIFGTSCGLYVDKYGRRMGCILFCILEIIINTLEHFPNLPLLLLGRVLGGVSTSLLFSAFESWMVTEHRARGFPDEWLASTHGLASTGNGLVAVAAGVLAQLSADSMGDIGPFRLAIALTVLCLVFVLGWTENYGKQDTLEMSAFKSAWGEIRGSTPILLLGAIQALFEGAMYTFVFVWVPTILKVAPSSHTVLVTTAGGGTLEEVVPSSPPLGLIFAAFMVCITLGGLAFGPLTAACGLEWATVLVTFTAALTMVVPVVTSNFAATFAAFLLLEGCVGCWFACSATMRSKYIDDKLQSSIMTIFRVPLNVLVVVGTRLEQKVALPTVFTTCAVWFGLSCLLQAALAGWADGKRDTLAAIRAERTPSGKKNQ